MARVVDISEHMDKIISLIKKETDPDPKPEDMGKNGIVLTYRDISSVTGLSPGSSVTRRVMETLKDHPNIRYEYDTSERKSRQPLRFTYVTKEEKIASIGNDRYSYLTVEEVDCIKKETEIKDISFLLDVLLVANYLKSLANKEQEFNPSELANLPEYLLMTKPYVDEIVELLLNKNLVLDLNSIYRLSLDMPREDKLAEDVSKTATFELTTEDFAEEYDEKLSDIDEDLSFEDNLKAYAQTIIDVQDDFKDYIEGLLEEKRGSSKEVKRLEEELKKGHKVIERVIRESQDIKDENKDLKRDLERAKLSVERHASYKDDFLEHLQGLLEVFQADILVLTATDRKTPVHIKNSNQYRARFQNQINEVASNLYNEARNYRRE